MSGPPLALRDLLPGCRGAAGLGPRRAAALRDAGAEMLLPVSKWKTKNWEEIQGFHMRKSSDFQEIPHITSSSSSWLLFTVDESRAV